MEYFPNKSRIAVSCVIKFGDEPVSRQILDKIKNRL